MKPLTIKDFNTGIAESPYMGFSQMVNVDIFTKPGALLISKKLEDYANSASLVTGIVRWTVQDPDTGDIYCVDDSGVLYHYDGSTWSIITGHGANGTGSGLYIWKGYLFYARAVKLDVMKLSTGVWTNDWQTLESTLGADFLHPIIGAQDDALYVGNGHFVDRLIELALQTFDPTNGATYAYDSQALELNSQYIVTTLEELGAEIAIGTQVGLQNIVNLADMFFWDGFSEKITGSLTIRFAENGVWQVKNINNNLFTIAGTGRTRLFQSATSQATEIKKLNNIRFLDVNALNLTMFPDAIEQKDGELLFGVSHSIGSVDIHPMGVYSYRNGVYALRHLVPTGADGSLNTLFIGSIKLISGEKYLVSYYDADSSTYGISIVSNNLVTGYQAYADSAVYQTGTDDDPRTFEKCSITLGKRMRANDKIKILARRDLDDTFVQIAEFLGSTYAGKSVIDTKLQNMGSFMNIQIKIQLDCGATATESLELINVTLT